MGDPEPFSVLNEKLRPKFTAMERLLYSLDPEGNPSPNGSLRGSSRSSPRATMLEPEPEPLPEPQNPEQDMDLVDLTEPAEDLEDLEEVNEDLPEELDTGDTLLAMVTQCLALGPTPTNQHLSPCSGGEEGRVSPGPTQDGDCLDGQDPGQAGVAGDDSGDSGGSGMSSPLRRHYNDRTLPDLIRSGRPLSRRRTLGPVSDTLKEVRREVELSRRRSLRLKAQVDKLQENREGTGDRVTQEVLSVLRLLLPLTEPDPRPVPDNTLDSALVQLKNVARKLAVSHSEQGSQCGERSGKREEDTAVLQQALRDRDDAIEKKKAMETELLRSKTEMMSLNNQLLEAVQKRLEMSLELEGWKEDIQLLLRQQLQSQQQQAEEQLAPKKTSRLGLLRRNNKPVTQRPGSIHCSPQSPTNAKPSQTFLFRPVYTTPARPMATEPGAGRTPVGSPKTSRSSSPAPAPRTWMDKLRRGRGGRHGDQEPAGQEQTAAETGGKDLEGFFNVELD